jgi:hypothetical protein
MLTNITDNVENYFKSNTESVNREYYDYPKMNNTDKEKTENINNFIGVFCPRGYYYQNDKGKIEIVSDKKPIITSSQQISNNLNNYISNSSTGNSTSIETFSNYNNNNNINCVYNDLLWILVILFFLIFLNYFN